MLCALADSSFTLEQWLDFVDQCFEKTARDYFSAHVYNDPHFDARLIFIVHDEDSNSIVSTLRVFVRQSVGSGAGHGLWAGIGEVCTSPGFRCRGFATRLLDFALEALRKDGRFTLATLHAGHYSPFYVRLGWIVVPRKIAQVTLAIDSVRELASRQPRAEKVHLIDWQSASASAIPHLSRCHERYAQHFEGCFTRSAAYWELWVQWAWQQLPGAVCTMSENGYMVAVAEGANTIRIIEYGCLDSEASAGAFWPLLAYTLSHLAWRSHGHFSLRLPSTELAEALGRCGESIISEVRMETTHTIHYRLLDGTALLPEEEKHLFWEIDNF